MNKQTIEGDKHSVPQKLRKVCTELHRAGSRTIWLESHVFLPSPTKGSTDNERIYQIDVSNLPYMKRIQGQFFMSESVEENIWA